MGLYSYGTALAFCSRGRGRLLQHVARQAAVHEQHAQWLPRRGDARDDVQRPQPIHLRRRRVAKDGNGL